MKQVYVVFIASNYKTGAIIRTFTRRKYNHVALALSADLSVLHAFARCNHYEAFNGGYQMESPARYLIDDQDSQVKICRWQVTDAHYDRICAALENYRLHRAQTRYNFADLLVYPMKKHIPVRLGHTCVSFLGELLEFDRFNSLRQLENIFNGDVLYEGGMRAWVGDAPAGEQAYFARRGRLRVYRDTTGKNLRLCRDVALICLSLALGIDLYIP